MESGAFLVKQVASCSQTTREQTLRLILKSWLSTQPAITDNDMRKLCKAFFYCVWHSDKLSYQPTSSAGSLTSSTPSSISTASSSLSVASSPGLTPSASTSFTSFSAGFLGPYSSYLSPGDGTRILSPVSWIPCYVALATADLRVTGLITILLSCTKALFVFPRACEYVCASATLSQNNEILCFPMHSQNLIFNFLNYQLQKHLPNHHKPLNPSNPSPNKPSGVRGT